MPVILLLEMVRVPFGLSILIASSRAPLMLLFRIAIFEPFVILIALPLRQRYVFDGFACWL